jgi:hypothetical protein
VDRTLWDIRKKERKKERKKKSNIIKINFHVGNNASGKSWVQILAILK